MTAITLANGVDFPVLLHTTIGNGLSATTGTVDAAGEKYAHIGRLRIEGAPTGTKTLSSAGGSIGFKAGACTFANGSTSLDIGIQDVDPTTGIYPIPDGTFDVKATLTGGSGITQNVWNTIAMTTGSKAMSHGSLISVVWDMTARGGADSVQIQPNNVLLLGNAQAISNAFVSSAWQASNTIGAGRSPNILITFDDGTKGIIESCYPLTAGGAELFSDSANPDERGMIFQVPWDGKIDSFWAYCRVTDAASDFSLKLYRDTSGAWTSPELLQSTSILAEQTQGASMALYRIPVSPALDVVTGVDYAVTLRATGSSNNALEQAALPDAALKSLLTLGSTYKKISRQNDTGAFTIESPALTLYCVGVRFSEMQKGGGGFRIGG